MSHVVDALPMRSRPPLRVADTVHHFLYSSWNIKRKGCVELMIWKLFNTIELLTIIIVIMASATQQEPHVGVNFLCNFCLNIFLTLNLDRCTFFPVVCDNIHNPPRDDQAWGLWLHRREEGYVIATSLCFACIILLFKVADTLDLYRKYEDAHLVYLPAQLNCIFICT